LSQNHIKYREFWSLLVLLVSGPTFDVLSLKLPLTEGFLLSVGRAPSAGGRELPYFEEPSFFWRECNR